MSTGTIIIAGAGIGGLTAALALAEKGFPVMLLDRAEQLEETGAGIQLSPNATRILIGLGLRESLKPVIIEPIEIRIRAQHGGNLARLPLGAEATARYGAPYWVIHRADLQAVLLEAVRAHPRISLKLGADVTGFTPHPGGVAVQARHHDGDFATDGIALIAADGLWSSLRAQLGHADEPRFARRTAWRAIVPADQVSEDLGAPLVHLWLGHGSHLVHYPVRGGALINVVAIAGNARQDADRHPRRGGEEIAAYFPSSRWADEARALLSTPGTWLRWPLYDRPPIRDWGRGSVTLLGDAAHPMLPFLAQGAAMAIEDAAVLADCLGQFPTDVEVALRRYEQARAPRARRVQRAARWNSLIYHLGWPGASVRNLALRVAGGEGVRTRYDWIYRWRLA